MCSHVNIQCISWRNDTGKVDKTSQVVKLKNRKYNRFLIFLISLISDPLIILCFSISAFLYFWYLIFGLIYILRTCIFHIKLRKLTWFKITVQFVLYWYNFRNTQIFHWATKMRRLEISPTINMITRCSGIMQRLTKSL